MPGIVNTKAVTRTRAVSQSFIRTNARRDARGKAAAAEDVVHDRERVVVRIVAHGADVADAHASLIHVRFVHGVNAGD